MSLVPPGSRVWHISHGGGVVEKLVAGRRVRVRFDNAPDLPRTVLRAELKIESDASRAPSCEAVAGEPAPAIDGGDSREPEFRPTIPATETTAEPEVGPAQLGECGDVRQTLEALRLGVVPSRFVADYTVGRDVELRRIEPVLDDGHGFRAVWGGYGAGKTHLLDVVEQLARERGFATARTVLDPLEVPPTHPKRLYSAIIHGLRLPDSADLGFEPLAQELCESPQHLYQHGSSFSRFLSPYLHVLRAHDDDAIAVLRGYVEGEPEDTWQVNEVLKRLSWRGPRALAMSDFRTYGRMYLHLIGTVASWVRDAGHRGLVLLFDEVEYVDGLNRDELSYAVEVLKHFAAVTVAPEDLSFDPEGLYKGGQSVHKRLPLRYREDQPLSVVFALTPLEEVRELYAGMVCGAEYDVGLRPLSDAHLGALFERVEKLYERGYPSFSWSAADRRRARERVLCDLDDDASTVRRVVQRTVFVLDERRYRQRTRHGA